MKDKTLFDYGLNVEFPIIKSKKGNLKVLSLFSGCGGMDIGFEGGFYCNKNSINAGVDSDWIESKKGDQVKLINTGFETVFANDIRPDAKSAWVSFFKNKYKDANKRYHIDSIVDLVKLEKNGSKVFPKNIDVITGGFPCQDFSVAGKRKGFNSDKSHSGEALNIDEPTIENRGHLYMWMKEVVSIVQPKMFIAENVKGLTTLENAKAIIEHDFATAAEGGYIVIPARVLHAANFGVPQNRERVIFYGFKKNAMKQTAIKKLTSNNIPAEFDPYPYPTHSYTVEGDNLVRAVTCKDVLDDLVEPEKSKDESQRKYSKAKFCPSGQGNVEINYNSIAPTIRSEHHGNIEFRRLSKEHGGKNTSELKKGLTERRLTVRECARIQTFPDDYQFVLPSIDGNKAVSASDAYKLIGNAVPCILAFNIAMRLKENWNLYFKKN